MGFIATPEYDAKRWDFITGDIYKGMSIAVERYYYLESLDRLSPLKLAFHDPETDKWTKWQSFPGLLWYTQRDAYGNVKVSQISAVVDVHRSMLPNEIVVESDYPTYEENYEASKVIGKILEEKGFTPHYYFSGSKSIHIHVFFSWDSLKRVDGLTQDQLRIMFNDNKAKFKKKFIEWLRKKMISCWDTNARKFDSDLVRDTHLVRAELSRNKLGYKTFLGYSHKDLSFVPYVCNESNRIYPKLGEIKFSEPHDVQGLVEEFMESMQKQKKDRKRKKATERSLNQWISGSEKESLRNCVGAILSEDFKKIGDGHQRAMFILLNELKRVYGVEQAEVIVKDWNESLKNPIKDSEIEYRLKLKNYSLSCDYIHRFLEELGLDVSKKCKGKIYK